MFIRKYYVFVFMYGTDNYSDGDPILKWPYIIASDDRKQSIFNWYCIVRDLLLINTYCLPIVQLFKYSR